MGVVKGDTSSQKSLTLLGGPRDLVSLRFSRAFLGFTLGILGMVISGPK